MFIIPDKVVRKT